MQNDSIQILNFIGKINDANYHDFAFETVLKDPNKKVNLEA